VFEKKYCGRTRGSIGQNGGHGHAMQYGVVMLDHWGKIF